MALHLTETWEHTLDAIRNWARINSPWAIHYNSGSCNGCDIEILATLTPRYDLERFGVKLQGSPRHADVLCISGPVTRNTRAALETVYSQMPDPKVVVAIGSCPASCNVFDGSPVIEGPLDRIVPVDIYVPGCPPRPHLIIKGIAEAIELLAQGQVAAGGLR